MLKSIILTVAVLSTSVTASEDPFGRGNHHEPGAHYTWGYNGETGAKHWDKFNANCKGSIQSPINIEPHAIDFATTLRGVLNNTAGTYPAISWGNLAGTLLNTGEAIKFTPTNATAGTFVRGATTFNLLQWHIHAPSEHRVEERNYPAEIHFVHIQGGVNLAVVGGFVEFGNTTSPLLAAAVAGSEHLEHGESAAATIDHASAVTAIKRSSKFYRYTGSLTTPPCTEGVKWLVAADPAFTITLEHFKILKEKVKNNARETMPLFNAYDANWAANRISDYFPEGPAASPVAAPAPAAH